MVISTYLIKKFHHPKSAGLAKPDSKCPGVQQFFLLGRDIITNLLSGLLEEAKEGIVGPLRFNHSKLQIFVTYKA